MGVIAGLGCVALLAVVGCGRGDDTPGRFRVTTLAEGHDRAMEMIDATIARVGGSREVSGAPHTRPTPCDDFSGAPSAVLFTDDYSKRLVIRGDDDADALVRSTSEYWRSQGFSPYLRDLPTRVPVVFATIGGFNLSLQVVRDKGLAEIGASTPCLPQR